jgi:GDPmannose 4,6-dehydratase
MLSVEVVTATGGDLGNVDTILITGISGQDGVELARYVKVTAPNVRVVGIDRRRSRELVPHVADAIHRYVDEIEHGDVTDAYFVERVVHRHRPDHLYHLAAQSFVAYSFENPNATYETNIMGTLNVLNAVRDTSRDTRVYFAGSSEMWGQPATTPQNEDTPFLPRSPYAVSKVAGFYTARLYREAYDMYVASGITGNHEGQYRGFEFVTQKVATWAARISMGDYHDLEMGNIDARKDWGWAGDYVRAFVAMLTRDPKSEYAIGTGEQHTVRDLIAEAVSSASANMKVRWGDAGGKVMDGETRVALIRINPKLVRPLEADNYMIDHSRITGKLGWTPTVGFQQLVRLMVLWARERIKTFGY